MRKPKPLKIKRLEICNFRAFGTGETPLVIDLDKSHLLVYGENGAGKSSFYSALQTFLEVAAAPYPVEFGPRNLFHSYKDGHLEITLADDSCWRWTDTMPTPADNWKNPQGEALWQNADKCKGFLDYKLLLQTYFLEGDADPNLFFLLVEGLLHDVENPADKGHTIGESWNEVKFQIAKPQHNKSVQSDIIGALQTFNQGLAELCTELEKDANDFLRFFDSESHLKIELKPTQVFFKQGVRTPTDTKIELKVEFFKTAIDKHRFFLNEAKLSALAIAIFLAAHRKQPTDRIKILAFDDVLIGLDMSNRMPFLRLLAQHFSDYQIFITTYDRAWFDAATDWSNRGGAGNWKKLEMFVGHEDGFDIPVVCGAISLLDQADEFYKSHHYKAAAVYARTHFEVILKNFCALHRVEVRYVAPPHKPQANEFWMAVQKFCGDKAHDDGQKWLSADVKKEIAEAKRLALDPLSHSDPAIPYQCEVEEALKAVRHLEEAINKIPKPKKSD